MKSPDKATKIKYAKLIAGTMLALLLTLCLNGNGADAVCTVTLRGQVSPVVQLSAGPGMNGQSASMVGSVNTGASASGSGIGTPNFSDTIDFGDLSRGTGAPVVASIGFSVRSNCRYTVVMSRSNYSATNMQFNGRDVSGTADGGSFITVSAGPSVTGGSDANPGGTTIASALSGAGIPLSQIASGAASRSSTVVATGTAASRSGGLASPSNAIDVPVNFSCPTGMVIGPVDGRNAGNFQATVQFEIFPDR